MKNLPGYIILASLTVPVSLTTASCLDLSFPLLPLALPLVGWSCAAGVCAIFLGDHLPRPGAPAGRVRATRRDARPHHAGRKQVRHGLHRNPATVSL